MSMPKAQVEGRTVDFRDAPRPHRTSDAGAPLPALDVVLPRIEGSVRADDRICPFSTSRLLVQFGPSADDILPQVLGDRLARAEQSEAGPTDPAPKKPVTGP